jgi:hypothetical protein
MTYRVEGSTVSINQNIDFSYTGEVNETLSQDIDNPGIYLYKEENTGGTLFSTINPDGSRTQMLLSGSSIKFRTFVNGEWSPWAGGVFLYNDMFTDDTITLNSVGSINLNAQTGINLETHNQGDIKIIAEDGNINFNTLGGETEINSENAVTITSNNAEVKIQAKTGDIEIISGQEAHIKSGGDTVIISDGGLESEFKNALNITADSINLNAESEIVLDPKDKAYYKGNEIATTDNVILNVVNVAVGTNLRGKMLYFSLNDLPPLNTGTFTLVFGDMDLKLETGTLTMGLPDGGGRAMIYAIGQWFNNEYQIPNDKDYLVISNDFNLLVPGDSYNFNNAYFE